MVHAVHPAGAAARTMALGRGLRHLRMALWDAGGFRPLRRATRCAASGLRDLGNALPVGKRRRRGILCQSKAQLCSHTGCMARSWAAAMAQKARRHPQTYRWQVAPQKKNRVKLLSFYKNRVQGSTDGGGAVTVMGVPVTGWKNETLWDQRHMGNSSGSDQYFRSPANGIPRPENCARI